MNRYPALKIGLAAVAIAGGLLIAVGLVPPAPLTVGALLALLGVAILV